MPVKEFICGNAGRYKLLKVLSGIENYINIRPANFVNIRFKLNKPRFNEWFKGQIDRRISNFCHAS